ncbi:MAG TPA: polysaccharide deacetylase family protein [Polyangiaceae bacterium]|nr:polysaccharide deacetylase family protein [Polyangiaceae bacterium]
MSRLERNQSKRQRFAALLHESGALSALLELRAHTCVPWLSILTYHRFPKPDGPEAFDDGVIDTSAEEFEQHLSCIKRHFTVVGVEELCAFAAGGQLPANPVAITFDDGYLDNYQQALPILQKHQCKAIFFVATSFIDERRVYWWDRVAYCLKQSKRAAIELSYPQPFRVELDDKHSAIFRLLRFIKVCPVLDMARFLAELDDASGVTWTRELERAFADELLMSWDHVRALKHAGMDVESHTRSHRILQTLPAVELTAELEGSRRDLLRELGDAPRAVAYPVGKPLEPSSPVRAALRRAGYRVGLTNGTGPTPTWGARDPFDIRRQTVARGLGTRFLLSILALPPLAPKHPWLGARAR